MNFILKIATTLLTLSSLISPSMSFNDNLQKPLNFTKKIDTNTIKFSGEINLLAVYITPTGDNFLQHNTTHVWKTIDDYQRINSANQSWFSVTEYNYPGYNGYEDNKENCLQYAQLYQDFVEDEEMILKFNNFKNVDRFMFIFENLSCLPWAGLAWGGHIVSWINYLPDFNNPVKTDYFYRVALHELGHDGGLGHDNLENYVSFLGRADNLYSNYMVSSKWMWDWLTDEHIVNIGTPKNAKLGGCENCLLKTTTWIQASDKGKYYKNKKYGIRIYTPVESVQIWIEHRSKNKQPDYKGGLFIYWNDLKRDFTKKPRMTGSSEYISMGEIGNEVLLENQTFFYRIGNKYIRIKNMEYDEDKDKIKTNVKMVNYKEKL